VNVYRADVSRETSPQPGWTPIAEWSDEADDFAIVLAEAQPNRFAP